MHLSRFGQSHSFISGAASWLPWLVTRLSCPSAETSMFSTVSPAFSAARIARLASRSLKRTGPLVVMGTNSTQKNAYAPNNKAPKLGATSKAFCAHLRYAQVEFFQKSAIAHRTDFVIFNIQVPNAPFGLAWYNAIF
jgi:hypothetical protein